MYVYLKAQTLLLCDRIKRFDSKLVSFLVGLVLCISIVFVHSDTVKMYMHRERSTSTSADEVFKNARASDLPPPGRAPDDVPEV